MNGKKKFLEVEFTLPQPGDSFQQVALTKLIAHFKVTLTVELIDAAQPELVWFWNFIVYAFQNHSVVSKIYTAYKDVSLRTKV